MKFLKHYFMFGAVFAIIFLGVSILPPQQSKAQISNVQNFQDTEKISYYSAKIIQILKTENRAVLATMAEDHIQTLNAQITEGDLRGEIITVENSLSELKVGDRVFVAKNSSTLDGREFWTLSEPNRLPWLGIITVAFIVLVVVFGGVQGLRGLLSLVGSLLVIIYVLLPAVIAGYSPILISIGVAGIIIIAGSYITHGFSRMTSSAVVGMVITIIFTSILAWAVVVFAKLSGYDSEEAVYLNLYVGGTIDIRGILLGGILIGLLGALYDVAIGQALAVDELHRIAPHASRKLIYSRAIRMGREHIGALVNTLAIAYVGAALPLLLLFYTSTSAPWWFTVNREIFAVEIVRTMVGSIGLVVSVPITTLLAVWLLMKPQKGTLTDFEQKKIDEIVSHGHIHGHGGNNHIHHQ